MPKFRDEADDDRLDGGAGNDYLYGSYGNDVLIAGDGADRLYDGVDKDVFALTTLDANWDRFYDYSLGLDVINITDILEGYDAGVDDLNNFVQFVAASGDKTYLTINADGDAGGAFTTAALIYTNFGGQGVDDLLANGTLVADVSA
ncbi:MAG TPA: type I secretion C-terminal target domain-containing protein [Alphaproteobacteria bacterium]|nr:type I secretion C-terminal target domain-containing protein [Alphaproteobacteria bacterium]